MAWPGSFNWNNHGSGVDHAPPPPRDFGPFANPEFWQRCFEERRGWGEDWDSEHSRGPHGHGFGRRGGRRHGGRRGHGPRGEEPPSDGEEFPPEYIDDEEVAAAVAEEEKGHEKDGDDDTTMRADTPDTEASEEEGQRPRSPHGRHGRRRSFGGRGRGGHGRGGFGRGGFGRAGFGPKGGKGKGEHRRHGSGPRGFHHPPPPPPFFGAMFGGPGPHGPHDQHEGPPPPPFFEEFFGAGPRGPGGPHGRHHHGPPPPPFFEGLFGGGPGPRGGPGGPGGHHPPPPPPHSFFEGLFGAGPGPRGGPGGHHHHPPPPPGPHGPPPPPEGPAGAAGSPFDFRPWLSVLANHPYARNLRDYLERAQGSRDGSAGSDEENASFTPPLDLFEQQDRWVLHMAVPGAKKEDVGVSWDADRSVLRVSGVVHRPGDEEFLQGLVSGERSTGLFAREVRLPPPESGRKENNSKDEVDAEGIEAKMEDGILIVTVRKVEKSWTEVKKVDIQ